MKFIVLINAGVLTHPAGGPYESETSVGISEYSRVTRESFLVNFSIRSGEFWWHTGAEVIKKKERKKEKRKVTKSIFQNRSVCFVWFPKVNTSWKCIFTIAACCIWQTPGLLALLELGVLRKVWLRPQVGNFLLFSAARCLRWIAVGAPLTNFSSACMTVFRHTRWNSLSLSFSFFFSFFFFFYPEHLMCPGCLSEKKKKRKEK